MCEWDETAERDDRVRVRFFPAILHLTYISQL